MDTLEEKTTTKDVRDALEKLPDGVDDIYREAMTHIELQNGESAALAKRVLTWIVFSERPLSFIELQHAVSTLPEMANIDSESLVQEHLVISVCAGLVVVDGNTVRLVRK
jgi:ankyrin repeat domain-containing protein 50